MVTLLYKNIEIDTLKELSSHFFKFLVFFLQSVTHDDTETMMMCSIYFFNLMPQTYQLHSGLEYRSEVLPALLLIAFTVIL